MLSNTFLSLIGRYSADDSMANMLWLEIVGKYSERGRYYHTMAHLDNLLAELTIVNHLANDWDCLLFAMYYHDIIYKPGSGTNEENSAVLAQKRLDEVGFPSARRDNCVSMILATKHHALSEDQDTNLFCDADLAILGQSPADYNKFAEDVRREYSIYPDLIYNPGRAKVLRHFLDLNAIFKTGHFYSKYENAARINISNELARL